MSEDCIICSIALYPSSKTIVGWMSCQGQELPVNQYQAVYSLITNIYGGDAQHTKFNLPDLRGRVPTQWTTSSSSAYANALGKKDGAAGVTLQAANLPLHTHPAASTDQTVSGHIQFGVAGTSVNATTAAPGAATAFATAQTTAATPAPVKVYAAAPGTVALGTFGTIAGTGNSTVTGASTLFSVVQPSLVLNYLMCLVGIYPMRP